MESKSFFEKFFISPFKWAFSRFGLPIILSTIIGILTCIFIIFELRDFKEIFYIIVSLGLAFFLTISAKFLQEKLNKKLYWIYAIIFIYVGIIYALNISGNFLSEFRQFTFLIANFLVFLAFVFWVPYDFRDKDDLRYANFFQIILQCIFLGLAVGIITMLLGFLAIFSIQTLFEIDFNDFYKIYPIYATLIFSIFAPTYILSNFPKYNEIPESKYSDSKQVIFTNKYIIVPFAIAYFVILYLYSFKVLINFENWPKWIISYLVIIFSAISLFVYITTTNIANSKIINIFRKILPFAVFFQLFMLFYSIGLRINQYWLTTNRYLVVLIGIILAIISIYLIFSKRKRIVFIPAIFSIFGFVMLFGPWGIYQLPYILQSRNFFQIAWNYNIFDWEKFIKNPNLTLDQKIEIREKIDFLCSYENNCSPLEKFLSEDMKSETSAYFKQNSILEQIGIESNNWFFYNSRENDEKIISLKTNYRNENFFYKISDYDYFVELSNYYKNDLTFNINQKNNIIQIFYKNELIFDENIENKISEIYKKYENKMSGYYNSFEIEEPIIIEFENENFKTKLNIRWLNIVNKNDEIKLESTDYLNWYLMILDKNNKITE